MNLPKIIIEVHKSKAFDELYENCQDLIELCELIPEWQQHEARPIAKRIMDRQTSWITIKKIDGE